jgi:hypothetical protein
MKKKLPVSATAINDAHRCARESAENAIEWAVKCGHMLAELKASLPRGEFDGWIESKCEFSRATAYNYIRASKSSNALDGSAIRHLFPSGRPGTKSDTPKGAVSVVNPEGGRTTAAKEGTEETGKDRPAAPVFDEPFANDGPPAPKVETPKPDITSDRWVPDDDEDEILARAEKEYQDSVAKVMDSDDRLVAAHDEIKRQAAEIAALKVSRDGYMNGKLQITKMLKAEQRKVDRLTAELDKLRGNKAA